MASIQNAHLLTDIFGYWPTFHDAEVHSVLLEHDQEHGSVLEAKIHVFEMTSEVDDRGYYVLDKHTLVLLRFLGLTDLELCDFNHQNVMFGLGIKDIGDEANSVSFEVDFDASYGLAASFKCQEITVLSAAAYQVKPPADFSPAPEGLSVPEG